MRHLLRALARVPDPLSDAALLARYAADRDPAAFEVLVWRHGGMVLGVCRRHLRDAHAAEDAFQATFLVLSRKAGTVRGDTLPGWLHRVARRSATRAATKARRRRETSLSADPPSRPSADGELSAVLDAEIDRLPDRLRQVVVLCYLDGETTEAAATRLGIPRGTVLSRLYRARAKLAARLTRRGVTPLAVGLTAILTAEQVAGGVRSAGGGLGPATILANEVLAMSGRRAVLAVAVGLVLAGGAGTGVGVLSAQSGGPQSPAGARKSSAQQPAPTPQVEQPPTKPTQPDQSVSDVLAKLNSRIASDEEVVLRSAVLEQRIENGKQAIRFYEAELIRLTAKKSSLEAQASVANRLTEQDLATAANELADALAVDPEYTARSRLLTELWLERVRTEASGKDVAVLANRVAAAEKASVETRKRFEDTFSSQKRRTRAAAAETRERLDREALQVTENEIKGILANRRDTENDILKWTEELRKITTERISDIQDRLRLLRTRRQVIELGACPERSGMTPPATSWTRS